MKYIKNSVPVAVLGVMLLLAACQPSRPEALESPGVGTNTPTATISPSPTTVPTVEQATPTATPIPYRLRPGDLLLAANPDDIPALDVERSDFVGVEAGNEEWELEELVIGLDLGGETRAYPVRLLSLHEIVNDEIGERPVAVTWCPLCYTAIVFDRRVEGQTLTFGVSGYLFNSNLVMFDRQTETLWSQLLGQGIRGAYRNEWLQVLPSQLASWGDWQQRHPDTLILSAVKLGMDPENIVDPYVGYYSSGVAGLSGGGTEDERLPGKALVVGVQLKDQAKAYLGSDVQELELINDQLSEVPLVLVYDSELESIRVYDRMIDGQQLVFEPAQGDKLMRDKQTGSQWRRSDGEAIEGPLQGEQLEVVESTVAFWFAWTEFQPDTMLFQSEDEE